jgi:predicted nucleotidyltransferase
MMDVLLSEIKEIPVLEGIIALYVYGSIVHGKLRNDIELLLKGNYYMRELIERESILSML